MRLFITITFLFFALGPGLSAQTQDKDLSPAQAELVKRIRRRIKRRRIFKRRNGTSPQKLINSMSIKTPTIPPHGIDLEPAGFSSNNFRKRSKT
jgi:hypothetical protein